jgi:hypothetical protein
MNRSPLHRSQIYWLLQIAGWLSFTLLNLAFVYLNNQVTPEVLFGLLMVFVLGIGLTQIIRSIIIRFNWLKLRVGAMLPRILSLCILCGVAMASMDRIENHLLSQDVSLFEQPVRFALNVLNFSFVFLFWSAIYYLFHFIVNFRKAEIEKLKWEAAISEAELNRLKSQLNPHFLFNAMNAIRALVDENPAKAKDAITQYSNILRSTLQMGKSKLIPLHQEMELVRDYLALEGIRLEERLRVDIQIDDNVTNAQLPPMMVQTLVENGIKHGISKLPKGGELSIRASLNNNLLHIKIINTGQYDDTAIPESGFGLANTQERLKLLYGNQATFNIENVEPNLVISQLSIPQNTGL